jgi:hypothetical protein
LKVASTCITSSRLFWWFSWHGDLINYCDWPTCVTAYKLETMWNAYHRSEKQGLQASRIIADAPKGASNYRIRPFPQQYNDLLEDENIIPNTIRILCVYFRGIYIMSQPQSQRDMSDVSDWIINYAPAEYKTKLIWMTAILLSRGLATSSSNWCTRIFTPVLTEIGGKTLLALASTRFIEKHGPLEVCQFHIITTPRNLPDADRRSVMATDPKSRYSACVRLFPDIEGT